MFFNELTNFWTKFHEDWTIHVTSRALTRVLTTKTAPPPGCHVFQRTRTIFKLSLDIIRTIVLNKFHEHWTINMTPRVLKRFYYSYIIKNATPPGSHIFQRTGTILKLKIAIIRTNVLNKYCEDWTINVSTAPLPGGHFFPKTGTILELCRFNTQARHQQDTALTNLYEDREIHLFPQFDRANYLQNTCDRQSQQMTPRVFTRQTAPTRNIEPEHIV
ncbi:hypothetical protein DPMN_183588 [Dreissena polymorpha]|uniref:Uncharacterized protein n=1 Tax=Dreissena polymorpha TaxID=45954 RepID=A0A9D4I747_DREPO|nr:hypothetical protein DPMN_183588 [Dreissena polymorpha]